MPFQCLFSGCELPVLLILIVLVFLEHHLYYGVCHPRETRLPFCLDELAARDLLRSSPRQVVIVGHQLAPSQERAVSLLALSRTSVRRSEALSKVLSTEFWESEFGL